MYLSVTQFRVSYRTTKSERVSQKFRLLFAEHNRIIPARKSVRWLMHVKLVIFEIRQLGPEA